VIIGGGFCGLTVLDRLSKSTQECSVTLIDQKSTFDFLPLLPDIIGGRISPEYAICDLKKYVQKCKAQFICERVEAVDVQRKIVSTAQQNIAYDYLVIASGAETAYHGNISAHQYGYGIRSVVEAQKILDVFKEAPKSTYVIAGGGYTGIEVATNIWRYFSKRNEHKRIVIIERSRKFLKFLPEKLHQYVKNNLLSLNIEMIHEAEVKEVEENRVVLSNGEQFEDAMVLWTAGVKVGDWLSGIGKESDKQGRINVDEYLRVDEHCFVMGDAANIRFKDSYLRMAVQFTLTQGFSVANNILRSIRGRPLKTYNAIGDLGYVCPMANNSSVGIILGLKTTGFLPTFFHYFMCIFRTYGWRNRLGILEDVLLNPKK